MTLGTVYGTDESDILSFDFVLLQLKNGGVDLFIQNGQKKIEPVYNESPEDCRPAWPCRCNVCVFLVLIYTLFQLMDLAKQFRNLALLKL